MGYKMLGFVVWQGARWYVRRRASNLVPSRRTASAAAVAVTAVSIAAVAIARRGE
jgi:hypothetical protein